MDRPSDQAGHDMEANKHFAEDTGLARPPVGGDRRQCVKMTIEDERMSRSRSRSRWRGSEKGGELMEDRPSGIVDLVPGFQRCSLELI